MKKENAYKSLVVRGQVVKSTAGHDRDDFQVVLEVSPPYVTVCDGKRRSLSKPKRKKLLHIAATKTVIDEENLQNDRRIRTALREHGGEEES